MPLSVIVSQSITAFCLVGTLVAIISGYPDLANTLVNMSLFTVGWGVCYTILGKLYHA